MQTNPFALDGKICVIAGAAGLLGPYHARAIARQGGTAVLLDLNEGNAKLVAAKIAAEFGTDVLAFGADITDRRRVLEIKNELMNRFGRIDVLINNAANNPKVEEGASTGWDRFEDFSLERWQKDINVGLTGVLICCQILGEQMRLQKSGSIINIASYLGLLAPEPKLYHRPGVPEELQPVKPVSYTVVKAGLLGLTKYLAGYWGDSNVRVNAITPGGVYNNQPNDFVEKISLRIPLARMAQPSEFEGAIAFLASDASTYVTGANVVVDGGRVCW
jgi:NAD(P)-dependent dehydrogenase (short-subunit alcohol dehydrogenase family)